MNTTKHSKESHASSQNRRQDRNSSAGPNLSPPASSPAWNPNTTNPLYSNKLRYPEMNRNEQSPSKNGVHGIAQNWSQLNQYNCSTNNQNTHSPVWIQQNPYGPNQWYPPPNAMMQPPMPYWPPNVQIPPPRIY